MISEGGISVGPSHANGGIKFDLAGKPIELEGDEIDICTKAYNSKEIHEYTLSPYNILMAIQKHYGCNTGRLTHVEPGEYIICKKVIKDTKPVHVKGTVRYIVNKLQADKGCVVNMNGCSDGSCEHEKMEDGGLLLAPNGTKSNLSIAQYALVRTPAFKAWFGDWENDPTNASKVVDENGEPMVMYHGTQEKFTEFDASKTRSSFRYASLFFTTHIKNAAKIFANMHSEGKQKPRIIALFVNARNIFNPVKNAGHLKIVEDFYNRKMTKIAPNDINTSDDINIDDNWALLESKTFIEKKILNSYDAVSVTEIRFGKVYHNLGVFESSQLKLADGTNATFDAVNPDIRFATGGPISPADTIATQIEALKAEKEEIWKNEADTVGDEKREMMYKRQALSDKIHDLEKLHTFESNKSLATNNGGALTTITDKKETEHINLPDFTKVSSVNISFDEDNILAEPPPIYIPIINEDTFRSKGYVFDAIRVADDTYILATNGYKDSSRDVPRHVSGEAETDGVPDYKQGYILATLDQLALISDYYFTKARATERKNAEESNTAARERYFKLPIERRELHFAQRNYYNSLPAAVKKKITREEWEALDLAGKETLHIPIQKSQGRRLTSKLEDNQMWQSFHKMYERFVNPLAVEQKGTDSDYWKKDVIASGLYEKATPQRKRELDRYGRQTYGNPETFEYWHKFLDAMHWKIKDIAVQRQFLTESRSAALETSFGASNTNDSLYAEFGILVKRQNGEIIGPAEIEQIRKAWQNIQALFGGLAQPAKDNGLKISHTGTTYVFASKAAGVFIPQMQTIAASAKFGDQQFENILAHETAHWIDFLLGKANGKRWATDDFEGPAGIIASTFRKSMNVKSKSDYYNATKECFARALEQYFAITTHGPDASLIFYATNPNVRQPYFTEDNYVSQQAYETKLVPLIKKWLAENELFFKFDLVPASDTSVKNCKNQNNNILLPHFTTPQQQRMENKPVYVKNIGPQMPGMAGFLSEQGRYVKFTDGSDGFFADEDLVEITELPIAVPVNITPNPFSLLPVKEYKLPKYKAFKTEPTDKTFMDIHADFTGDMLGSKLVLLGTHFDSAGATSLDAYKMLFTPYRGDQQTEFGNYCHTKKCFKHKEAVEEGKYFAYRNLLPRNSIRVAINEGGLYNYLKNAIAFDIPDKVNHTIGLKISQNDITYVVDAHNLLIALKAMFELGHKQLEFALDDDINTPIVIYPAGEANKVDKYETDFALFVTKGEYQNRSAYTSIINIENGCATFVDNQTEFCFDLEHMAQKRQASEKAEMESKLAETENVVKSLKQQQIDREQRDIERRHTIKQKNQEIRQAKADKKTAEALVAKLTKMI